MHFAIIGAGVIGLNTALQLQQEFPNAAVTILADRFTVDTTSDVAAGIFRPSSSFPGPNDQLTRQWITDSFSFWDKLRATADSSLAGVTQMSCYLFSSSSEHIVRNPYLEGLLPMYRRCTDEELTLCPGDWKFGSFFTTTLTECRMFQPWATKKFQEAGGKIVKRYLKSFTDLNDGSDQYDLVINCSGLGAKQLCADRKLVPLRGQVVKVKAPWLKTAFYGDFDTYVIPGFADGLVTLGGCRQYDSWNLNVDKFDSASIRERCERLVPSLRDAEFVREAVGLRPHRDPVRVEMELIDGGAERQMKVVHNYGHGGYGVTTAPGTARYAVRLVREMLSSSGAGCATRAKL